MCARTYHKVYPPCKKKFHLTITVFSVVLVNSCVQYIRDREAVGALCLISPTRIIIQLLTNMSTWHRYSNTLLVSLNNRISIRDTSVAHGGVVRSPAGTFPTTTSSGATTEFLLTDMEKHQNAFKISPLEVTEPQERVIAHQ